MPCPSATTAKPPTVLSKHLGCKTWQLLPVPTITTAPGRPVQSHALS